MGIEKVLSCYNKVAGRMSKNYPTWSTLAPLSLFQKLDEAQTFGVFKKLNSSVNNIEKRKIDCSELRKRIETAHSHFGKQRRRYIHDIQMELATKKLEQAQEKGKKVGIFFAKSNISNLNHPIIKYTKNFAIASLTGIWVNKNNLKESAKTNDNKTLLKQLGLIGLTFGTLPIIFKTIKNAIKTSSTLVGSKLPITASLLSIATTMVISICGYRTVKNFMSDKIFENDEIEQAQTSDLEQSDDTEPSINYEC